MLSFPILDIQIQTQKPLEKEAWKQTQQIHIFWSKVFTKLSNGVPENIKKTIKNQAWI